MIPRRTIAGAPYLKPICTAFFCRRTNIALALNDLEMDYYCTNCQTVHMTGRRDQEDFLALPKINLAAVKTAVAKAAPVVTAVAKVTPIGLAVQAAQKVAANPAVI